MNKDSFALQRPELVAYVLANCFMLAMIELRSKDVELGRSVLDDTENKVDAMCDQLLVPIGDQAAIQRLFEGIRDVTAKFLPN